MICGYHYFRGEAIAGTEKKRRGRPKTGIGPNIGLRLYPELEAALDAWIEQQPEPRPSRPEAIRNILGRALIDSHGGGLRSPSVKDEVQLAKRR
jgi:hypothetical protein